MRSTLLILLVGCGWSEHRYFEEKDQAFCDQMLACGYGDMQGYTDVDACLADRESGTAAAETACVDYDGVSAKECVTEYRQLGCDELFDGDKQPEACAVVCSNGGDTGG